MPTAYMHGLSKALEPLEGEVVEPDLDPLSLLMMFAGVGTGGFPKGYSSQKFSKSLPVVVRQPGLSDELDVFHDAVKGLNPGHALYRARENWPGADVQSIRSVWRRLMGYE